MTDGSFDGAASVFNVSVSSVGHYILCWAPEDPDPAKHPDQHAMFAQFAAHLEPLGSFSGWASPESMMVSLLSKKDGVVVMGAPNDQAAPPPIQGSG